jgi:putative ABC transport system permease protein
MNLLENIRLAWEGLKANKMRSILTMLGIIIGIASVIAILTVGNGMTAYVSNAMNSLGASNITLSIQERSEDNDSPFSHPSDQEFMGANSFNLKLPDADDLISDEMIEAMRQRYKTQVVGVGLSENMGSGQAKDGRNYANINLIGTNAEYEDVSNVDMLEGRFISESNVYGNRYVAVVSDKLVNNMFGGDQSAALSQELKVYIDNDIYTFLIVGVYEYEESIMGTSVAAEEDITSTLYIPISTAKHLSGADSGYQSITVKASESIDSTAFADQLEQFFGKYYENNNDYTISAISMKSITEQLDSMMNALNIAISAIAGISLLVGGIGVMNIMLVSVTERTREIGTRKALGATNANIRTQFIVESTIVCLMGGIVGVILGMILGYFGSSLLGFASLPTLPSIGLAVGFSMVIGIFFGYYPANKAAKLDPIEALRYE